MKKRNKKAVRYDHLKGNDLLQVGDEAFDHDIGRWFPVTNPRYHDLGQPIYSLYKSFDTKLFRRPIFKKLLG